MLFSLPNELISLILNFIEEEDYLNLRLVDKRFDMFKSLIEGERCTYFDFQSSLKYANILEQFRTIENIRNFKRDADDFLDALFHSNQYFLDKHNCIKKMCECRTFNDLIININCFMIK